MKKKKRIFAYNYEIEIKNMKKIYFTIATLFITLLSFGQTVWINEIHYDNAGADTGEGFEIAGPAGTDLSTYTVELYNGNGGAKYATVTLTGIIADQGNAMGVLWFAHAGMQNGAPDGLALINAGTVIQFLSYEGSFTATSGTANGMASTDIGVSESNSTPVGQSLQLIGTGNNYNNFTWSAPTANTAGQPNTGQVLPVLKQEITGFSMYPNPVTNGEFTIRTLNNSNKNVQIFDLLGKLVYSKVITASERVQVSNLNEGIYILKVEEEGKTATRKLVIE